MRYPLFSVVAASVCALLLGLACFFSFFWIRSFRYTDDIFPGEQSIAFRALGISRFKSQGGGIWTEFRPAMVRTDTTSWQDFRANGDYCFIASPAAGLAKRLGFTGSRSSQTWVFPCWFPVGLSMALGFVVILATRSAIEEKQ